MDEDLLIDIYADCEVIQFINENIIIFLKTFGLDIDRFHTEDGDYLIQQWIENCSNDIDNLAYEKFKNLVESQRIDNEDQARNLIVDPQGPIITFIDNQVDNLPINDLCDALLDAYVNWMSEPNWENGNITREEALNHLQSDYQGTNILKVDEDVLTDLVAECLE